MSKIAHYLQEHLVGEVTDSLRIRQYFSRDSSVLEAIPSVIVYPANEADVRKTARFVWQLAQRGKVLPITPRGSGSDTSGAAIGHGVIMSFTAHMNRLLSLDPKKKFVTVEPGITFQTLQQTLYTHGLFLPPQPVSLRATVGGSLAKNAIGKHSLKYGDFSQYVERLSVVLANGEIIETGPLSKRELNKKLGLTSLEGEVYRQIDTIIEENQALLKDERSRWRARHNRIGYNIFDVKQKKSFDLTPLILGSQGSLGIITEATLKLDIHNPKTISAILSLDNVADLQDILPKVLALKPSSCEMVSLGVVALVNRLNPNYLKGVLDHPGASIHLILEFDNEKDSQLKKVIKSLRKISEKTTGHLQTAGTIEDKNRLVKLKNSVSILMMEKTGNSMAVPVAEDLSLPIDRISDFLQQVADTYSKAELVPAFWGHAGEGVIKMRPTLDLGQTGHRQKLFKIQDTLYNSALQMGGNISASAGDGRIRAPYMRHVLGAEGASLMMQIKKAFDPAGILNRGVKTASADEVKAMMRTEYSHRHHDHLPSA